MANNQNLKNIADRSTEVQREIRSKGGKAAARKKRERKTIADALRLVLEEKTADGLTRQEMLVAKCLANAYKRGDIKDLKTIAEILGELKQTISAEGLSLNISTSESGKTNIERIMEGE